MWAGVGGGVRGCTSVCVCVGGDVELLYPMLCVAVVFQSVRLTGPDLYVFIIISIN